MDPTPTSDPPTPSTPAPRPRSRRTLRVDAVLFFGALLAGMLLATHPDNLAGRWIGDSLAHVGITTIESALDHGTALAGLDRRVRLLAEDPMEDVGAAAAEMRWLLDAAYETRDRELVRAHLIVLLLEAGDAAAAKRLLDDPEARLRPAFVTTLGAAYPDLGEEPRAGVPFDAGLLETADRPGGWCRDRLEARWSSATGRGSPAAAEERIRQRGRRLVGLEVTESLLWLALLVAGIAALIRLRGRRPPEAGDPWPPWPAADGYVVVVLGAATVLFLHLTALGGLAYAFPFFGVWYVLFLFLPALWLARSRLLLPAGLGLRSAFGLRLDTRPDGPLRRGLPWALVPLGAEAVVARVASRVVPLFESVWRWWEGWDPTLLSMSWPWAALSLWSGLVWAPLVEEIAFRGLLYGTLRHHLTPFRAAVVSAWVFAAYHSYGGYGFLTIYLIGIVMALVYERTRTLLPCMLAHGAYNLVVMVYTMAWYR